MNTPRHFILMCAFNNGASLLPPNAAAATVLISRRSRQFSYFALRCVILGWISSTICPKCCRRGMPTTAHISMTMPLTSRFCKNVVQSLGGDAHRVRSERADESCDWKYRSRFDEFYGVEQFYVHMTEGGTVNGLVRDSVHVAAE